ncbi:MAG: type III secretion system chaperone [Nitrospinota bacterium]|nr:type III secretion system chaperone [Nitrospinota bacterium]
MKRRTTPIPALAGCLLTALFFAGTPPSVAAQARMTVPELGRLLEDLATGLKGDNGRWEFRFDGVPMIALADERADRMRVISFIEEGAGLDRQRLLVILRANFDRTLDARYALFRGFLVSIFLHPLSALTGPELESGLKQVSNLVRNYGGTYSSGGVRFGLERR